MHGFPDAENGAFGAESETREIQSSLLTQHALVVFVASSAPGGCARALHLAPALEPGHRRRHRARARLCARLQGRPVVSAVFLG